MKEAHEPRPEFVHHLEWQVRTAFQRQDRFASPTRQPSWSAFKMIPIVLLAAFLGAGAVWATEQVQDQRIQEVVLARIQGQLRIAQLQLDVVAVALEETRDRYDQGIVGQEALLSAELRYQEAEMQVARLRLDSDEVLATGREPQDELSAPLVDGKDFVMERLDLQADFARRHMDVLERRLSRAQTRVEMGVVEAEELTGHALALEEARYALDMIQQRMALRREFLQGEITGDEAEAELQRREASRRLGVQTQALENARLQFQRVEDLVDRGLAPQSELAQARIRLLEIELELQLVQRTLEALGPGTLRRY